MLAPATVTRFWAKVRRSEGCWLWTADKGRTGAGRFWYSGRLMPAARLSWQIAYGPVPNGMVVRHSCGTSGCVRPDHLSLSPQRQGLGGSRSQSTEERFWRHVQKSDGCWYWTGAFNKSRGYGQLYIRTPKQQNVGAHRVAYELFVGPIPPGMFVCHTCDTPLCVRPDHLFLGTHADNEADKVRKGRASRWRSAMTHCKRGHEFTPENTYVATDNTGRPQRHCRACRRARQERAA